MAVCGGVDDKTMQRFDGPAGFDELLSEVVEEFGMRGLFAADTEVVCGGDDSLSKVPGPDAVDDVAGGEGMIG